MRHTKTEDDVCRRPPAGGGGGSPGGGGGAFLIACMHCPEFAVCVFFEALSLPDNILYHLLLPAMLLTLFDIMRGRATSVRLVLDTV